MKTLFLAFAGLVAMPAATSAATYRGVEIPAGEQAFADAVVSAIQGDPAATSANFTNPQSALGTPDYADPGSASGTGSYSLGSGGFLTLRFIDNRLTTSGDDTADLYIFEIGPDVEDMFVSISADDSTYYSVGAVGGGNSSVDIDAFDLGGLTEFAFVRLQDDPARGGTGVTAGADIDAVAAISSIGADVPLPAAGWLFLTGLGGLALMRKRSA